MTNISRSGQEPKIPASKILPSSSSSEDMAKSKTSSTLSGHTVSKGNASNSSASNVANETISDKPIPTQSSHLERILASIGLFLTSEASLTAVIWKIQSLWTQIFGSKIPPPIPSDIQNQLKVPETSNQEADKKQDPLTTAKGVVELLFNNPKALREALEKGDALNNMKFSQEEFRKQLLTPSTTKIMKAIDQEIVACMKLLSQKYTFSSDSFYWKLNTLIECDCCETVSFIVKNSQNASAASKHENVKKALDYDSSACFAIFLNEWGNESRVWSEKNTGNFVEIASYAAEQGATKCLSILARENKLSEEQKKEIASEFRGYPEIVLSIFENNVEKAAAVIFEDLIQVRESWLKDKDNTQKLMKKCVTKMLRFTSIENTEKIYQSFLKKCTKEEYGIIDEFYQSIKKETLLLLPYISRHNKPKDVKEIILTYSPQTTIDSIVEGDLKYAESSREQVKQLLKASLDNTLEFEPNSKFRDLPPSKSGSKKVALLLEKIALFRSEKQANRGASEIDLFKALRTDHDYSTPVIQRYEWGAPLIRSVYNLSKSTAVIKQKNILRYSLYYVNHKTNVVTLELDREWNHGLASLMNTWPFIEDLFQDLMNRDLSLPKDNSSEALEDYKQRLDKFYSSMAVFFGCMGNTQPLKRGSGTVSEFLFAMLHMKHGLKIPILKPDFPQFDVLNITLPSDDYAAFFTYFFEPQSLPEYVTVPKGPTDAPLYTQMEALYALPKRKQAA